MNNLIFRTTDSIISSGDYPNTSVENINIENHIDIDDWMHHEIEIINTKGVFCNIFIPLCFGTYYTEFLGLRFAHHIRTTKGNNQIANIYLYGTEFIDSLISHEFFSILQTKGVHLIDNNLFTIKRYIAVTHLILNKSDLVTELNKIQLALPNNLNDNHSVANIWGMYRLLELEGIDQEAISILKTRKNSLNNIYFKWLIAKNATGTLIDQNVKEIRQLYSDSLAGIKVVRKIDLSQFQTKKKR